MISKPLNVLGCGKTKHRGGRCSVSLKAERNHSCKIMLKQTVTAADICLFIFASVQDTKNHLSSVPFTSTDLHVPCSLFYVVLTYLKPFSLLLEFQSSRLTCLVTKKAGHVISRVAFLRKIWGVPLQIYGTQCIYSSPGTFDKCVDCAKLSEVGLRGAIAVGIRYGNFYVHSRRVWKERKKPKIVEPNCEQSREASAWRTQ